MKRNVKTVGWLESVYHSSTTGDSETTVGNLKFRWNTNDYLEIQKVANANSYNATEKHFKSSGITFKGNHTASGSTQYNTSDWKPIYWTYSFSDPTGWNIVPVSLGTYEERQFEIYEQNSISSAITHFAVYKITTFKNGWGAYSYNVTYIELE